ncbi:FadR/GntR family transcriptional regulator [Xylophilus sp.]|uniref:FadR/GntR family transcriptional regulator n=1 Tax=Xylophilus sp. TaxID=2653893 RepID=UPI002D80304B|nr:FadR/GntR family transcriptional regulator [Xylophilus sp.]
MDAPPPTPPLRKPRSLAHALVEEFTARVHDGRLSPGDKLPTEAEIMRTFGVSRTVVREAISKLQAAGLMQTRHGIGTFVNERVDATPFRIGAEQLATLNDVIAVLELRIGIEAEAAALAATRRTEVNLQALRDTLAAFTRAVAEGGDAVAADFQFHLEIARATQNVHFSAMLAALGSSIIPRARLTASSIPDAGSDARPASYLEKVNAEHESIVSAIAARDPEAARTAMRIHLANSRERRRLLSEQQAAR